MSLENRYGKLCFPASSRCPKVLHHGLLFTHSHIHTPIAGCCHVEPHWEKFRVISLRTQHADWDLNHQSFSLWSALFLSHSRLRYIQRLVFFFNDKSVTLHEMLFSVLDMFRCDRWVLLHDTCWFLNTSPLRRPGRMEDGSYVQTCQGTKISSLNSQ